MIKRLHLYFKEMYPIIPRLILGVLFFAVVYAVVLLNNGVTSFNIGYQEAIGSFTIFAFLMLLRIADDFKDYETDLNLYPQKLRPLPSGKTKKSDLKIAIAVVTVITFILNLVFMNNIPFFLVLYFYGFLMTMWFFQKEKIQPNLMLALVTHNPVQILIAIYVISFTCIKYALPGVTVTTALTAFMMYLPALIWEVGRKIRAPKNENEYVTYSKLFGYKRVVWSVMALMLLNTVLSGALIWNIQKLTIIPLVLNYIWMFVDAIIYTKNPEKFDIKKKVERFIYIEEALMAIAMVLYVVL